MSSAPPTPPSWDSAHPWSAGSDGVPVPPGNESPTLVGFKRPITSAGAPADSGNRSLTGGHPALAGAPDSGEQQPAATSQPERETARERSPTRETVDNRAGPASLTAGITRRLAEIEAGWQRFGKGHEIGRGGCGVVESVEDRTLHREVVIKRISSAEVSDEAVARFLNEARITGQLEHPGIVPVHELGIDDQGLPYYAMKRLRGVTLAQCIVDYRQLPLGAARQRAGHDLLRRFVSVCQTLAFAHGRGIIHRDLKPANIMVGELGETVVLDWGLARSVRRPQPGAGEATLALGPASRTRAGNGGSGVGSNADHRVNHPSGRVSPAGFQTLHGVVMGTAAYMSPEQARGCNGDLTERSDVFSLGVILYEILSGVSPFQSTTVENTLQRITSCDYRPLDQIVRGIPRPLRAICHRALRAEPGQRYADARELADDLENCLAGNRVSACQERWWERLDRFAENHRTLVRATFLGVVAVTLVALVSAGLLFRSWRTETGARQAASAALARAEGLALAERAARETAQTRLEAARQAADRWLIDLSGDLQFYPGLAPLRADLLTQAQQHYEALLEQDRETSQLAPESAWCLIRLGDLARLQGRPEEADQRYALAAGQLRKWIAGTPAEETTGRENARVQLANALIGRLLAGTPAGPGQDGPVQWIAEAETIAKELVSEKPDWIEPRNALVRLKLVAARRAAASATWDVADQLIREALPHVEILVQQDDSPRQQKLRLTLLEDHLAALQQLGQPGATIAACEDLLQFHDRLVARNPDRPDWLEGRSLAFSTLGACQLNQGQSRQAVDAWQRAAEDLSRAWRQMYGDPFHTDNRATLEFNLALGALALGREEEARDALSRAVDNLRQAIETAGVTSDRVLRMADCYLQLAPLVAGTDRDQALDLLKQHAVLVHSLESVPELANEALEQKTLGLLALEKIHWPEKPSPRHDADLRAIQDELNRPGLDWKTPAVADWLKGRVAKSRAVAACGRGDRATAKAELEVAVRHLRSAAGLDDQRGLGARRELLELCSAIPHAELRDWTMTVQAAEDWAAAKPDDPNAWHWLAVAWHGSGDLGAARQALERALQARAAAPLVEDTLLSAIIDADQRLPEASEELARAGKLAAGERSSTLHRDYLAGLVAERLASRASAQ